MCLRKRPGHHAPGRAHPSYLKRAVIGWGKSNETVFSIFLILAGGTRVKTHMKVFSVALAIVTTLLLAGCPPRESIEKINRDPMRYAGKEVTIAGRVVGSWGALGFGGFEIDDGTGRMWVISEHFGVPGRDAKVAVTGTIQQGVTLGGRSFATVMRQTQRRHGS